MKQIHRKPQGNSHKDKDALMQAHTHIHNTYTHFTSIPTHAHTLVDADCKRVVWPVKKIL